jgi:hypothetical protein
MTRTDSLAGAAQRRRLGCVEDNGTVRRAHAGPGYAAREWNGQGREGVERTVVEHELFAAARGARRGRSGGKGCNT